MQGLIVVKEKFDCIEMENAIQDELRKRWEGRGDGVRRLRALRHLASVLLVAAVGAWTVPPDIFRIPPTISAEANPNVAEGSAWWDGQLHLTSPVGEIVQFRGKWFNIYPPLMSIVAAVLHPLTPGRVSGLCVLLTVGIAVPALAYLTFTRAAKSPEWGAVLTVGYLFGSPMLPMLLHCFRGASVYFVNQGLSQLGLLLLLYEFLGRRRAWVMGIGLVVGAWSRQLMIVYALATLWASWQWFRARSGQLGRGRPEQTAFGIREAWRALAAWGVSVAIAGGMLMMLNLLKFDSPLDSGYGYLKALTVEQAGSPGHAKAFSLSYVPRNFYYMHLSPPQAEFVAGRLMYRGGALGTSIWITTPLLLYVLFDLRRIARDRGLAVLLLCAAVVLGVLLTYFNTGYAQRGYSRFTLDFLAVLFVAVAPSVGGRVRRFITPSLVAWSVLYFYWITQRG